MGQHSGLTQDRWSSFSTGQQILMIGNEMNRAKGLFSPMDKKGLALCYERVIYLTNLTIQSTLNKGLRKELLRWRNLITEVYISLITVNSSIGTSNIDMSLIEALENRHLKIFKVLLLLKYESASQIPYLIKKCGEIFQKSY